MNFEDSFPREKRPSMPLLSSPENSTSSQTSSTTTRSLQDEAVQRATSPAISIYDSDSESSLLPCYQKPAEEESFDECGQRWSEDMEVPSANHQEVERIFNEDELHVNNHLDILLGSVESIWFKLPNNRDYRDNWDRLLVCKIVLLDMTCNRYIAIGLNANNYLKVTVRLFGSARQKLYLDISDFTEFYELIKILVLKKKCSESEINYKYKINGIDLNLLPKEQLQCSSGSVFLALNNLNIETLICLGKSIFADLRHYKKLYDDIYEQYKTI